MRTEIWSLLLRSGSAHLDLALAVEVRRSEFRGQAVPTKKEEETLTWHVGKKH